MKIPISILIICAAVLMTAGMSTADYNYDGFPVVTRANGTVSGGVYTGYEPWASSTTLTGYFNVPDGSVRWAYLYTGIWGGTENYEGWVNVTFNNLTSNGLGAIHLQGKNDTNDNVWCSGHGKHWIYYNVTNLTNAGINTAVVSKINSTAGSFDGRVYGIALVVVYEDGSDKVQYWINDGSDALNYKTPRNNGTTYFNGTLLDNATKADLTMLHLTGYEPPCNNCLWFNGHMLDTSLVDTNDFELNIWDVTDYTALSENNAAYTRGEDPFVNICNAILTLKQICGDVTGNNMVDTGDVILLANYVGYPGYTLRDEWTGDVTGNNVVDTGDVILLANYVGYPGYELKCA